MYYIVFSTMSNSTSSSNNNINASAHAPTSANANTSTSIKMYDSLQDGFIASQNMPIPQFYRREKCGCTFLHYLHNGVWNTDNEFHREDCIWKKE